MARKKQEEAKKGSPEWMTTFSDLMNLLLCFFVLLFSMSTVDAEKFTQVIASLQSSFSILPQGGASIGEGTMVSAGISQLENLDIYFKEANTENDIQNDNDGGAEEDIDIKEEFKEASLAESEQMAEEIETLLENLGIADKVELKVDANYVQLTLNGALLFDSGKAEIREEALPLVDKLGIVAEQYLDNRIYIEGHTDNVPMVNGSFNNNDDLSAHRALAVKDYFIHNTLLNADRVRAVSCGEYSPVADNSTAEGRALNRRVEIKIYNTFSSE